MPESDSSKPHVLVSVCQNSECKARGSDALFEAIKEALGDSGAEDRVSLARGGCWGLCNLGPNVVVRHDDAARSVERNVFGDASFLGKVGEFHYGASTLETVRRIVAEHLLEGRPIRELASDSAKRATAKKLSKD